MSPFNKIISPLYQLFSPVSSKKYPRPMGGDIRLFENRNYSAILV